MAYRANRELGLGAAKAFQLRIPSDLWKRIEKEATRNGRSLNAEVMRLTEVALNLVSPSSGSGKVAAETAANHGPANEPERALLDAFRSMAPETQLSLITLIRGLQHRGRKSDGRG